MRAGGRRRVVELEAGSTQRRLLLQGDNNMKVYLDFSTWEK